MLKKIVAIAVLLGLALPACGDWPQFRGPNSSGVYQGKPVPIDFGPGKNELWKLDLPPGHSSPCIHGNLLYVTAFEKSQKNLEVICVNRIEGKIAWRKSLRVSRFEKGHPSFNPASSSPATDGERVVAYFGSYGLVCFDKTGVKLWEKRMPITRSYSGNATSPAIVGNKVILYRGNQVDHFVLAVDKQTGKQIWKVPQEEPFALELACTSCPVVDGNKLILHSARSVQALEIETGNLVWVVKCATTATSTPVLAQGNVIVAAWNKMGEPALRPKFPPHEELLKENDKDQDGNISRDEYPKMWIFHRPEGSEAPYNGATLRFESADTNRDGEITPAEWNVQLKRMADFRSRYQTHGMLSIPIQSKGLIEQEKVITLEGQGVPEVPSPITKDGLLYFVKNGGGLTCLDLKTGKRVYRIRTKGKGTHYASPIIGNEHLYSFAGDGKVSVVSLGRQGKVVASNEMGERVYATPAFMDGVLYVRTHEKLYAFGMR